MSRSQAQWTLPSNDVLSLIHTGNPVPGVPDEVTLQLTNAENQMTENKIKLTVKTQQP